MSTKKTIMNLLKTLVLGVFMTSCGLTTLTVERVAELNMVSTRNVNPNGEYIELKRYAGVSGTDIEKEISRSKLGVIKKKSEVYQKVIDNKSSDLKECLDNLVREVPGGVYLTNVRIYQVVEPKSNAGAKDGAKKEYNVSYIAQGDVWGEKKE